MSADRKRDGRKLRWSGARNARIGLAGTTAAAAPTPGPTARADRVAADATALSYRVGPRTDPVQAATDRKL
ncbi:hypothetical protein [Lysobacter sp. CA196]|uniref:hypothetical protein n=1 Tax=Lysobacter sp. CA196 TaxID=3455606 RepID=UPI003F8D36C5